MRTASSTVRRESWRACVILPLEVEQSSLSTEFYRTLKSLGSRETSDLCLPEPVVQPGPLWLPTSRYSLTATSKCGLPLQIVVRPASYPPVLVKGPRPPWCCRSSSGLVPFFCQILYPLV